MNPKFIALGIGVLVTLIMIVGYALIGIFGQPLAWVYATAIVLMFTSGFNEPDDDANHG